MSAAITITHKGGVRRIANWLKNTKGYPIVISELSTRNSETPDVIAFIGNGASVLIEVKISRSDFLGDKTKHFRRDEARGMGDKRYYAAPKDVITPADLPAGWGLLIMHTSNIEEVVEPTHKTPNKRAELVMLMSILRRLEIATAVYVRQDDGNTLV
jgi:hypothetical protein